MLINSWVRLAAGLVSRMAVRPRRRRIRPRQAMWRVPLRHAEILEVRVLLSSTLTYQASANSTLTLTQSGSDLQLVDSAHPSTILAHETAGNITGGVQIFGNQFDVTLTVDAGVTQVTGGITF